MPNWCVQNVVLSGERNDLQGLADIIASLPSREDVEPNGFGKLWLVNFMTALGSETKLRGRIDFDPGLEPSMCCPESEDCDPPAVEDSDIGPVLRFSIVTAWSPELEAVMQAVNGRFPSIGVAAHKEADEFYNFATMTDPHHLLGTSTFNARSAMGWVEEDDEEAFCREVLRLMDSGALISDYGQLEKAVADWNNSDDNEFIELIRWKVTDGE